MIMPIHQLPLKTGAAPAKFTATMVLLTLLSSCGENGTDQGGVSDNVTSNASQNSAPGSISSVTPALSAAQLSDNSIYSVQSAIDAVEQPANGVIDQSSIDAIEQPATGALESLETDSEGASRIDTPDLSAANTDTSSSDITSVQTRFESETTEGFIGEVLDDGIRVSWQGDPDARGYNVDRQGRYYTTVFTTEFIDTDALDGDNHYQIQSFDDDGNFSRIAYGLTVTTQSSGTADPEANSVDQSESDAVEEDSDTTPDQVRFESKTTEGFTGEVLDDGIRVSWQGDPSARGYNVDRQGQYYTTVFGTEFLDDDVYDQDYYYEVKSFDYDDNISDHATGLTVTAQSYGRTDPDAPTPNDQLLDDYELVFSDEFQNVELDRSKWNTRFLWGPDLVINSEEQYYVDIANDPDFGFNPFIFDGEHLTIKTIETPEELSAKANDQPYLSGIITSYDAFKFTYGYAETRAKFTHGRGYWPAFWLLNAYYGDADPEIDIMEFIGHDQDVIYHTYHYFDAEGELRSTASHPVNGIDFTAEFHTFGVEWMPGVLIFYVDGIETHRVQDPNVSQQEMYVLANQAVGGWWAGSPDDSTPLPGHYVIDYIRVYQRITPYEQLQFDEPTNPIPLFSDLPGRVLPNKRPPIELWPEGYPNAR